MVEPAAGAPEPESDAPESAPAEGGFGRPDATGPTPLGAIGSADRAIVAALYTSLRRFAAVVGPLEVEPDDLVQEALYRTLRVGPLSALDDPGAYVRRAIIRLAANERRHLGRRRRAMTRLAARDSGDAAGDTYPSDTSELQRLDPEDRAVLWLADVEGVAFADVAAALGCSEQAARTKASRARRRLRDAMGEDR
jgi:DNA-directed RNA polymerase specialized sigma24 family protein